MPAAVKLGSPALLLCYFLLDEDTLYTVKWYKNGREFYRYTPKESPSIKVFAMPGLTQHDILLNESNGTHVSLRQMSSSMAGLYSCEVSADAPSFHTIVVSGLIEVIVEPSSPPLMGGVEPRYRSGEVIHANCTSSGSRPAVNLTWGINGDSTHGALIRQYREVDPDDMEVAISTIRFHARRELFPNGRLRLKCTASIYRLYWQITERTVKLYRHNEVFDETEQKKLHLNHLERPGNFLEKGIEYKATSSGKMLTSEMCVIAVLTSGAKLITRWL